MKKITLTILLLFISICFSITEVDLSDRISIDGLSDDFMIDERILYDSSGSLLESPTDSYWGEYNDVKEIKVTWDATYLYLAVDACSWSNNVILLIDVYDDYGIEDMSQLNAWPRLFKFYNFKPDFLIGTWDTNNCPQFWRLEEGGAIQLDQVASPCELPEEDREYDTFSTFDTGNLQGSMEVKIPWEILKFENHYSIENIKLLALITSGEDYSSGPDCAPDNLGGMTNESGQVVTLDNYAEILVDEDGDGPDMNIEPQVRTTFYKNPPFEKVSLLVQDVTFPNGKIFSPLREKIYFRLTTNRTQNLMCKFLI